MDRKKLYDAEKTLKDALVGEDPKPLPFVQDSTLMYYSNGMAHSLMTMLSSSKFIAQVNSGELDSLVKAG